MVSDCLGVSERDRLGNAAADSAAGEAARRRAVSREDVAERKRSFWLLEAAQRVQAAAQLATLESVGGGRGARDHPPQRDWARVRRGARRGARSAPARAGGGGGTAAPRGPPGRARRRAAAAPPAEPPRPRGADLLAFFAGKAWSPNVAAQGPGKVACLRCAACAGTWGELSATPCPGWTEQLSPQVFG